MSKGGWYGVDLDGTLAKYESWVGPSHIGEPIVDMVMRVREWIASGQEVRIFTARVAHPGQREECTKAIEIWCTKHIGQILPITYQKDYAMIVLYDDRCVQVETNTGRLIEDCPHCAKRNA